METSEFLSRVLGNDGFYCIFAVDKETKARKQKFFTDRETLESVAYQYDGNGWDTYFALATFEDARKEKPREASNAKQMRAFFMDLDCGPTKDFATKAEAIAALRKFGKELSLPKPMLVDSGRGIHVYWVLEEPVVAEDWLPVAKALKKACAALDFGADPAVTADLARVLRVPGTHNYKGDQPLSVQVLNHTGVESTTLEHMRELLGKYTGGITAAPSWKPTKPLPEGLSVKNAVQQRMQGNQEKSFRKILQETQAGRGCAQIAWAAMFQEEVDEPMWRAVLSIAKFCEDGDKGIHMVSRRHPGYDPDATEAKAAAIDGPYTCATFAGLRPEGCKGCSLRGKIKSPISVGMYVAKAEPKPKPAPVEVESEEEALGEDVIVTSKTVNGDHRDYTVPPYPEPFRRGRYGGIYLEKRELDDEGDEVRTEVPVYPNDFYYVRRIYDPDEGETLLARLHLPHDGVREFLLPLTKATSKEELRRALSNSGVSCNWKEWDTLMSYTNTWTNHLQHSQPADEARRQFGWTSDDMKSFIIGDREIFGDHVAYSPPSSKTAWLFPAFEKRGTLEGWCKLADFYNRPGMEMYQFAVSLTLGSTLMQLTPVNAAVFMMYTDNSGFGKTTTQKFALSAYGHPDYLIGQNDDTDNSRFHRLEVLKNIPYQYDEATNKDPAATSNFLYQLQSGLQKSRMKGSANEERARGVPWKMAVVVSGNASLVNRVMMIKDAPKAEIQRILEYEPTRYGFASKAETDAFQSEVGAHVGHAIEPFVQYVINNKSAVKALMDKVQGRLDSLAGLSQENRFWSITGTVGVVGAMIAKEVGLVGYDPKALFDWTVGMIGENKRRDKKTAIDASTVLSEYLADNYNNILWIKSTADLRNKDSVDNLVVPETEPRQKLVARFETDLKKLYIIHRPMQKWCSNRQINYDSLVKRLKTELGATHKKMRLTKGTKLNMPPMSVLVVDCSKLDLDVGENDAEREDDT